MHCLMILSAVIVTVSCQWAAPSRRYNGDPSLARILSDQRAHHVAGDFRFAVKQEDGTNIEEEARSSDGTRRGQYSYINDLGHTETVKWEAGPGGFNVLNANNVPAQTDAWQAAADSLAREHVAAKARVAEAVRQAALKPEEVYEPVAQRKPAQKPHRVVNYNYRAPPQYQPQQYVPVQQPIQQQPIPEQQYLPTAATPTQAPKRFFPPGHLSLARNQLGYQYSFHS